jgi:hypothetical protein
MKDEKIHKKDCSKRNLVYKTWCQTCYLRDKLLKAACQQPDQASAQVQPGELQDQAGTGTPNLSSNEDQGMEGVGAPVKPMVVETGGEVDGRGVEVEGNTERVKSGKPVKTSDDDVPKYLYIGETCRSAYERGFEHIDDIRQLKPSSHLLKHLVDQHEGEDFGQVDFRMEIVTYSRTAYERQIMEAVQIQHHREHNLLNSKAEFNRSAIPRLGLKMGGKEYKEKQQEEKIENEKEENLAAKIRELRKINNKERRPPKAKGEPARKKRKRNLGEDPEEPETPETPLPHQTAEREAVKRKPEYQYIDTGRKLKQMRMEDCRGSNERKRKEKTVIPEEKIPMTINLPKEKIIDWEVIFEEHKRDLEKEERVRRERLTKADKMTKSWELAALCKTYIRENSNIWKGEMEEKRKLKEKLEAKEKRIEDSERKKNDCRMNLTQKKITETLMKLPLQKRNTFLEKSEENRRKELQEVKENLWKQWRNKKPDKKKKEEKRILETLEEKLKKLEILLELAKKEEAEKKEIEEERRRKLDEARSKKEKEQEQKKQKLERKKKLEAKWDMLRWITMYINENKEAWRKEKVD